MANSRWVQILAPMSPTGKTFRCSACGRSAAAPEDDCPEGVLVPVGNTVTRLPCSTWPDTLEIAKVAAQRQDVDDCIFSGTIVLGDKSVRVTSILPFETARELETIGVALKLIRAELKKEEEQQRQAREEIERLMAEGSGAYSGTSMADSYGGAVGPAPISPPEWQRKMTELALEKQRGLARQLALGMVSELAEVVDNKLAKGKAVHVVGSPNAPPIGVVADYAEAKKGTLKEVPKDDPAALAVWLKDRTGY